MIATSRSSETVLILGARSDIALAIARSFAKTGAELILAARSASRLKEDTQDIKIRYSAKVATPSLIFLQLTVIPPSSMTSAHCRMSWCVRLDCLAIRQYLRNMQNQRV